MASGGTSGSYNTPLKKFKLVFLGEQSGMLSSSFPPLTPSRTGPGPNPGINTKCTDPAQSESGLNFGSIIRLFLLSETGSELANHGKYPLF
ncbi:Ras-related protein Rab-6A [Ceratocystis lukuohia]|uniref:Ras-related protein Rab-6A n=1 Tax=Ceratocystis lukuohia TaxID=2019550 RepID=A0ABR4MBN8_9PEZI